MISGLPALDENPEQFARRGKATIVGRKCGAFHTLAQKTPQHVNLILQAACLVLSTAMSWTTISYYHY